MATNLKTIVAALALILGAVGISSAFAAEENRDADHAALRALRDKVVQGIDKQDIKLLASCFAKEFAFTAVNQTVVTNEAQMQEFFDRMFHAKDAIVTSMITEPVADILTRFVDANTGICYGSSKDAYTMKTGKVVEMSVRWSATVVKENGEWKVAIAHIGTDFLNNPVLDGVEKFTKVVGLGAAVVGLLVGLLAGRCLGRCSKKA